MHEKMLFYCMHAMHCMVIGNLFNNLIKTLWQLLENVTSNRAPALAEMMWAAGAACCHAGVRDRMEKRQACWALLGLVEK